MDRLRVLADKEVEAVHHATLRVLSEIGVERTHKEAQEVLAGAGARVRADRVLLPTDLVEQAISLCPHQMIIRSRGGQQVVLGDGSLHWHNLGGA